MPGTVLAARAGGAIAHATVGASRDRLGRRAISRRGLELRAGPLFRTDSGTRIGREAQALVRNQNRDPPPDAPVSHGYRCMHLSTWAPGPRRPTERSVDCWRSVP